VKSGIIGTSTGAFLDVANYMELGTTLDAATVQPRISFPAVYGNRRFVSTFTTVQVDTPSYRSAYALTMQALVWPKCGAYALESGWIES
jgi:hypothetical protein